ncbi:MAG: ABC transporter permease subunit [Actinomycetales bacterium]|nr:ABC transporter permease subunit [Actinomycetales bacterium]
MTSTTAGKDSSPSARRRGPARAVRPALVLAFWLLVWQAGAWAVGQDFLLASPVSVTRRLVELVGTAELWGAVGHSLARIGIGFLAAVLAGVATAALAAASRVVDELLAPAMAAVRAAPVVSFIILLLMLPGGSRGLAAVTSFLMVLPIVHTTVLEGIRQRDRGLLEMAAVFRLSRWRRLAAIDVPAVLPYLAAASRVGIGLAWKAGVAAEVIGLPEGSIGERMYEAKLLLLSADVLAWTVVVVALSFATEHLLGALLARGQARLATTPPAEREVAA